MYLQTHRAVLFSLSKRLEFGRKVCTSPASPELVPGVLICRPIAETDRRCSRNKAEHRTTNDAAALKTPSRSTDGMSLNSQNPWWCQSKTSERRQPRRAWTARVRDQTGWRSASVHHPGDQTPGQPLLRFWLHSARSGA